MFNYLFGSVAGLVLPVKIVEPVAQPNKTINDNINTESLNNCNRKTKQR